MTDLPRQTARRYDDAFRTAAVERALLSGRSIAATAAELGVSATTLRRWVRAHQEANATSASEPLPEAQPEPELDVPPQPEAGPGLPLEAGPIPETEAESGPTSSLELEFEPGPDFWRLPEPEPYPWQVSARRPEPEADPEFERGLELELARPSGTAHAATDADRAAALHMAPEPEWHVPPGDEAHETVLLPSDDIFPALARLVPAYRFPIILLGLLAAVAVSVFVPADYPWRPAVLSVHVISLVASFGAVLLIDWHGLLWLFGLRHFTESTRLAAAAGPIIWAGLAGLIGSGALLHPNLSSPLTILKLFLVLAVAWNGAAMSVFRRRLARLPPNTTPAELPRTDWWILAVSSTVSQIGWWGAIIIGFINSSR